MRKLLGDQENVICNQEANYNGDPINKEVIITYYAKDLFRFMMCDIQGTDSENMEERRLINITPCGYDVKKSTIANIDFRIKKWGNQEYLQRWRENAENDKMIYKGLDFLY